jgi:hypothetical protein
MGQAGGMRAIIIAVYIAVYIASGLPATPAMTGATEYPHASPRLP